VTITIAQERPDSPDASALVEELEALLSQLYPRESRHGLSVEQLISENVAFFVIRHEGAPAGCGGVKLHADYGEVKRMFVRPAYRRLGLAKQMLARLAEHARANGVHVLRLETGIHQTEAIDLYERWGFHPIPPFGPYQPDPLSRFFEKSLRSSLL
jgi:GNAT superfamily N-acetyltransferase